MKRHVLFRLCFALLGVGMLFSQCSEDDEIPLTVETEEADGVKPVEEEPTVDVSGWKPTIIPQYLAYTEVTARIGLASPEGNKHFSRSSVLYSTSESFDTIVRVENSPRTESTVAEHKITGLTPERFYFLKAEITLGDTSLYSDIVKIKTPTKGDFVELKPNSAYRLSTLNYQPFFVQDGKGYLIRGGDGASPSLAKYDPILRSWKNTAMQGDSFLIASSAQQKMRSFSSGGSHFVGLGYTSSVRQTGSDIFKIDLASGTVEQYAKFLDTLTYYHTVATHDNRVFIFASDGIGRLNVHEFDTESKQSVLLDSVRMNHRRIYFCQTIGDDIYLMMERRALEPEQTIYKFDPQNNRLVEVERNYHRLFSENSEVRHSFSHNGKIYFIFFVRDEDRNLTNQQLFIYDPLASEVELVAEFLALDNAGSHRIIGASFMMGSTLYLETRDSRFYMIEL